MSRACDSTIRLSFTLALGVAAVVCAAVAVVAGFQYWLTSAGLPPEGAWVFAALSAPGQLAFAGVLAVGAVVSTLGMLVTRVRRPWALRLMRLAFYVLYVVLAIVVALVYRATGAHFAAMGEADDVVYDVITVGNARLALVWRLLLGAAVLVLLHVLSMRRATLQDYARQPVTAPPTGERFAAVAVSLALLVAVSALSRMTGGLLAPDDGEALPLLWRAWRWGLVLWALLVGAAVVLAAFRAAPRMAMLPELDRSQPLTGDVVLEDIRTHGRDPRYRKSIYASIIAHLVVILGPLLVLTQCIPAYYIPEGMGEPVVTMVQIVKKKVKKKKYILNPDSPIYFHVPDLDESDLAKEVEAETLLTYEADTSGGAMGAGGKGKGGWPDGMGNHPVRFVRLKYNDPHWDDGMDAISRADINFLQAFHERTGFKVAARSEAYPIRSLRTVKKGFAPPFVYMTGSSSIRVNQADMKILRDYLLDGGMLVADAGSGAWDGQFKAFIRQVLPGQDLLPIADDHPIFRMPYQFPNGAPELWHHGAERRAQGMYHKGRLVVFYHPGDMNDAWKTGNSGMDPRLADRTFDLGVNIIYYAFTHYLEQTRKDR